MPLAPCLVYQMANGVTELVVCCCFVALLVVDVYSYGLVSIISYIRPRIMDSGIGVVMSANVAILVMGWPYAFGEFQAHPNLG